MSENKMQQSEPEYESDSMHPGQFLAGLLLGGLAGAGVMMLLAPHSGKRTRANIQRKSIELRDQATETVEGAVAQARSKAYHITNSVQREADHMQKRGQEILDEQKQQVSDKANHLQKAGEAMLNEQKQQVSDALEAGKSAIKGR